MRASRGFTLVELMIVVALLGVLASLAAPSFREVIVSQRVKSTSFDLIAGLSYARSEAVKRNDNVTITPVGGNWASGWEITALNVTTSATETLRSQPAQTNVSIAGPATIVYGRSGRVTSGASDIAIDDDQSLASVLPRCIVLTAAGIPRSKQGAC